MTKFVKKNTLPYILCTIPVIAFLILFITYKNKINSQANEISDLEDKIETLNNKVTQLEDEKEELENSIGINSNVQVNNGVANIYSPNINQKLSTKKNNNGQPTTGKGIAIVVFRPPSCDYFILENNSGFILAEWMGGNDPSIGDKIAGGFDSFGTKDFYNLTSETDSRLWIDDYWLSKDDALEKVRDKCQ